jgi:RNA polymerase sigma factor (sigma-70 family)
LSPDEPRPLLPTLLAANRAALLRFVERGAGSLLRHETAEDLVQGIQLHVLESAGRFEFRGEDRFLSWLRQVARRYLADRHRYWRALRRDAGRMIRISAGGSGTRGTRGAVDPSSSVTGPASVAARREHVALAMKALTALFPKDQDLLRWIADDLSIEEIAGRLAVSYDAAKQARLRAIERFRRTLEAISRHRSKGPEAGHTPDKA